MRLAWRWLKRLTLVLIAVLLLYGLASMLLPRIPVNSDWQQPADGIEIAVISNGVHTDIVMPVTHGAIDWTQSFPRREFAASSPIFAWISFGWGSRDFYLDTPTWADLRLSTALRALSGSGATAMHVGYIVDLRNGEYCCRLRISEAQYEQLASQILASFAAGADERVQRIDAPGYTPYDHFYAARGSYSVVKTCNEWTGARLRSIGVRSGFWTPWASDVLRQLRE